MYVSPEHPPPLTPTRRCDSGFPACEAKSRTCFAASALIEMVSGFGFSLVVVT